MHISVLNGSDHWPMEDVSFLDFQKIEKVKKIKFLAYFG